MNIIDLWPDLAWEGGEAAETQYQYDIRDPLINQKLRAFVDQEKLTLLGADLKTLLNWSLINFRIIRWMERHNRPELEELHEIASERVWHLSNER